MFSELLQDTIFDGIESGRVRFASSSGIAVSKSILQRIYSNLDVYRKKLVLRPMEISNHPEVVRRLGVIGINGALEIDLWGNVNSTHVCGTRLMNGIGGSGDFSRNCAISVFATPSVAKNGTISCIVPFCSHIDHTEHDTQIFVTECGIADVRGLCPIKRAESIINNCAHPDYRQPLRDFLKYGSGHIPIDIQRVFSPYASLAATGTMEI
jgi:succinyl-CoA:acetate CoA-transferase